MNTLDESTATAAIDNDLASDPWMRALASALDGSAPVDPMALVKSQLEAQAQANPKAAMVLRLIEQRRLRQEAQAREEEAAVDAEDESDAPAAEFPATEVACEDLQNLHDVVGDLYAELTTLRARNEALASATGSCPACFGEDPSCERCRGRGVPGSRAPAPAPFRQYVLPAMQRARAIERGRIDQPSRERSAGAKGADRAVAGPATSAF
jgi:hypothetical protein